MMLTDRQERELHQKLREQQEEQFFGRTREPTFEERANQVREYYLALCATGFDEKDALFLTAHTL